MADEPAGIPAQGPEPTEPIEPTEPEPTEPEPTEPEPAEPEGEGFNKRQLQQLGSLVGKIVSTQISEKIPTSGPEPAPQPVSPQAGEDALQKFNEDVSQKLFGGDPFGAFSMMMDLRTRAQSNLTQAQVVNTDKQINVYSDKPYYKEIYQNMRQLSHNLVSAGYPPEAACRTAYAESLNQHMHQMAKGASSEEGELGMLSPGKHPASKPAKLPAHLKAAAARDIEQGLFKDEKEWIEQLDPKVRAAYNI